jgi:hypothetical protein
MFMAAFSAVKRWFCESRPYWAHAKRIHAIAEARLRCGDRRI